MSCTNSTPIAVVVISHNSTGWLPRCVQALFDTNFHWVALNIVDNASTDDSIGILRQCFPHVRVTASPVNLGYAGGANVGIQAAASDVVVIMNPDVEVRSSTLERLAEAFEDPAVAIVGGKLLYPDGKTIQHAGGIISYPQAFPNHHGYGEEDRGQHDTPREVDYVTGALFAVRKSALERIGYFDEGFYPAYFEEVDLCFRARRAGYRVLYNPRAVAIHHESVTTGKDTATYYRFFHRNRIRFVLKHYSGDQLWRDFLPSECAWLRRLGPGTEYAAAREAYADNLAVLEGRATFLVNPANAAPLPDGPNRAELLCVLDSVAGSVSNDQARRAEALSSLVVRLDAISQLRETSFSSKVPVIGPLVVGIRRAWNWMSTKWYVGPVLRQQSQFNESVVEVLREVARALRAGEAQPSEGDAMAGTGDQLAALNARLRALESWLVEVRDQRENQRR